jgi:ribose transport system substrate-binding protein
MSGRKIMMFVSLLAALGLLIGACTPAAPAETTGPIAVEPDAEGMIDTSAFAKEAPNTICFSNASVANAWRVAMVQNFEYGIDEAKAAGLVDNYLYADANDDPAKQTMEMGVPVITLDRDVQSPANRVSYTDGDSCAMGRMQAEWLANELGGKGNILLLSGMAGASPAEERLRCAREVFAGYPDIKELAQAYTDWSPTGGQKQMEAWITQFGEVDGIWSDSALQGVGVVEALLAAGMTVPPITGEDWALFLHQAVDNDFPFAAVSFPNRMGYVAVQDALALLKGEPIPFHHQVQPLVITAENMSEYYNTSMSDELWLDMLPEVREKFYSQ